MNTKPIDNASSPEHQHDVEHQYPSAIYFQVHFEHLYHLMNELKAKMLAANHQIARINHSIEREQLSPGPTYPNKTSGTERNQAKKRS